MNESISPLKNSNISQSAILDQPSESEISGLNSLLMKMPGSPTDQTDASTFVLENTDINTSISIIGLIELREEIMQKFLEDSLKHQETLIDALEAKNADEDEIDDLTDELDEKRKAGSKKLRQFFRGLRTEGDLTHEKV